MIIFAFTPLIVGSLLLELDRGFGTEFFNPELGGSSLLWQHLFWIFGHPEVYIQFIPATGIVSMVLPVFVRHRIVGLQLDGRRARRHRLHVVRPVGPPHVHDRPGARSSSASSPPPAWPSPSPPGCRSSPGWPRSGPGRPVWRTPFLFVVGFMVIFVIGGITGVMVAAPPFDMQAHDSHFVVAHLHYVLIGGVAFPIFAGVYYWFPKFTGQAARAIVSASGTSGCCSSAST